MASSCRLCRLAAPLLMGVFLLVGCDSGGTETVVLNANSPAPPTVEYEFRYTSDNLNGNSRVEVASQNPDNLTSVLRNNGFSRSDVVSAQVDSVTLERISAAGTQRAAVTPKVFQYLLGAEVYLGDDDAGPKIAEGQFQTTRRFVSLPVSTRNVTPTVQEGATPTFLRLEVQDPSSVPDAPNQDAVEVVVYYRIEVEGV